MIQAGGELLTHFTESVIDVKAQQKIDEKRIKRHELVLQNVGMSRNKIALNGDMLTQKILHRFCSDTNLTRLHHFLDFFNQK